MFNIFTRSKPIPESVSVKCVYRCRRCNDEYFKDVLISPFDLEYTRQADQPFGMSMQRVEMYMHKCYLGEYGVLDFVGYDWTPSKDA